MAIQDHLLGEEMGIQLEEQELDQALELPEDMEEAQDAPMDLLETEEEATKHQARH